MKKPPKNHPKIDPENYPEKYEERAQTPYGQNQKVHQKRSRAVPQFIR